MGSPRISRGEAHEIARRGAILQWKTAHNHAEHDDVRRAPAPAYQNSLSFPARLAGGENEFTACFAAFRSSSSTKGCRSLKVKPIRSPLRHATEPPIGS